MTGGAVRLWLLRMSRNDGGTDLLTGGGSWARGNPSFHYLDLIAAEVEGDGLYIRQQV